jgi:ferredoxin
MTHVIFDRCIRDGACVKVCPVHCIVPGTPTSDWPLFYIDPNTCIDCGACVAACPAEAIVPEDDIADAKTSFIQVNQDFFESGPGYDAARVR